MIRLRGLAGFASALLVALPPAILAGRILSETGAAPRAWLAFSGALVLSVLLALRLRSAQARRLRTMSAVLAAFREGDFSVRARALRGDALVEDALVEMNRLGDALREHRLGEIEAWALLRKVLAEVDVVVLAFDDERRIKLANDAAARVLDKPAAALLGERASSLGLADLLTGDAPRVVSDAPPLGAGAWELRRGTFRLSGQPHALVVLSDLTLALRDKERDAWKRLIVVMGHEINNSLAPIQSLSETLHATLTSTPRPDDWESDVASGLEIIGRRAAALGRFMKAYGQLARLPPPKRRPVNVGEWVRRAVMLERRVAIDVPGGPDVTVLGDADQLDQLLINLLKNAVDAAGEKNGGVRVRWSVDARHVDVVVEDDGPGVADAKNLFVPFFTTKPGGSGIGLVLSRQSAEAHGGSLSLENRRGHHGSIARLRLPVAPAA